MKWLFCAFLTLAPYCLWAQKTDLSQLLFTTTKKEALHQKQLPVGRPLLVAYFRTDCDYCRHSAVTIKREAENYPATIWMVSPEDLSTITDFEEMNGLYQSDNLVVAQDHSRSMHQWFTFESIPFYVLFDQNGKQLGTFDHFPEAGAVNKALAP